VQGQEWGKADFVWGLRSAQGSLGLDSKHVQGAQKKQPLRRAGQVEMLAANRTARIVHSRQKP